MTKYVESPARTLFKGGRLPARPNLPVDAWFWTDAYFNLYRGCEHACRYCDGLNEHYHVDHAYSEEVHVKVNAPALLERELRRSGFGPAGEPTARVTTLDEFLAPAPGDKIPRVHPPRAPARRHGIIGVGGGVSDAYCPAEREYELTRQCLEVLRDFQFPVHVVTKSALVTRDLPLLKEINAQTFAMVSFSFSTVDETIQRVLEPYSSPAPARLAAMAELAGAGVHTGAAYMPVIPTLTDSPGHVRATLEAVADHGGQYYLFGGLTLKGGRQKETFFTTLETHFPAHVAPLQRMYARSWNAPRARYRALAARVHATGAPLGLKRRAPRYFPPEDIRVNLALATRLATMAYCWWELGLQPARAKAFSAAARALENLQVSIRAASPRSTLPDPLQHPAVRAETSHFLETGTCPSWTGALNAYSPHFIS